MDYEAPAKRLKKAASREQAPMPSAAGPRNNYADFNEKKMKMRMLLKLSDYCIMKVTRHAIVLVDEACDKFAVLNFRKFSTILMHLAKIDEAVMKLRNYESVNVRYEIGGNWAVTITSGVGCVNIRRWFYKGQDPTPYPTRIGMSLRLPEWNMFK